MTESPYTTTFASPEEDQYQQYRTLSFSAVVTFVFGLLAIPTGIVANMNPFLLIFPFIGIVIGILSVLKLKDRQQEFTGFGLARSGLALSTILFFGGAAYASYVYSTEVPEGFQRLKFTELQPDPKFPQIPIPPSAAKLDQTRVFVKGYVYPDEQLGDIKRFILVPDMGTCCFGGQPKLTDMMQVTLEDPHRVKYSMFRRSLAGTFRLGSAEAAKVGTVVYHLEDAIVTN